MTWTRRSFLAGTAASLALAVAPVRGTGQDGRGSAPDATELASRFADPPVDARPRIWWFWGESVTTDAGITLDLEAYRRAGFGGVVLYEQVFKAAADSLESLSPPWLARVRHAAAECARLGLALEINVGNGYVAGGPWITPDLGMQRLVFSETLVTGGDTHRLPQPDTVLDHYRDVACLAYPAPAGSGALPRPARTSNSPGIDLDLLFDPAAGRRRVRIAPRPDGAPVLIELDYGSGVTVRSLSYAQRKVLKAPVIATQVPGRWGADAPGACPAEGFEPKPSKTEERLVIPSIPIASYWCRRYRRTIPVSRRFGPNRLLPGRLLGQGMRPLPPLGTLQASDDGATWRDVVQLPALGYQHDRWDTLTVSFPAVTARRFRLRLHGWPRALAGTDHDLHIGSVVLRGAARIDRWESKTGNFADFADPDRTPPYGPGEVVDPATIVDLTGRLSPDGSLAWTPPRGQWTVLRLGHTPTGVQVKHGAPGPKGLECDKLSAVATRVQFDHYVRPILEAVRQVPGARIEGIGMDSAEYGSQNWTPDFLPRFRQRRGYDLQPWLPAMAGIPVGSADVSDRVLFDVRRTIADLLSDEHFGTFTQLAGAAGMTVTAQAPGIATCMPSDAIQARGKVDVPMGEFWVSRFGGEGQPEGTMDCREAASAAHLHGKAIVAAEAFTGSPAHVHPALLKPFADAAFANGVNRMVVLAGNHQPYDDRRKPGVTEDKFFLPYQRNNTWWDQGAGFWHMLGRASFLLRQGRPVVDLLYHLGSDTPLKIATARMHPAPPSGHDYDVCGDGQLLRARADGGELAMPEGMRYPVLVLAGGDAVTLAAARHVRDLVRQGVRVIAPVRWQRTPGFAERDAQAELAEIAHDLWGHAPQPSRGMRRVGVGMVAWGDEPDAMLAAFGIGRDFQAVGLAPLDVLHTHRQAGGLDVYFVANHRDRPVAFDALFRHGGPAAQAWDPDTGHRYALPGTSRTQAGTLVPLRLERHASLFVVFGASPAGSGAPPPLLGDLAAWQTLAGPWELRFDPAWGGPARLVLPTLACWTTLAQQGARHYSGTVTYRKQVTLPRLPGGSVWLDLGKVEVAATVLVNGTLVETLWRPPHACDVTRHLKPGVNALEIRVTNLWANRLIADAGLAPERRISWATFNPYGPGDALLPSGLLGPVTLRHADERPAAPA